MQPQTEAQLKDLERARRLTHKLLDVIEAHIDEPEKLKPLLGRSAPANTTAMLIRMLLRIGQAEQKLMAPQKPAKPASSADSSNINDEIISFADEALKLLEKMEAREAALSEPS